MHHKKNNNNHSTDNHNQPQHEKYPTNAVKEHRKHNLLSKLRERFKEKDATPEEIRQLKLNTMRDELKTRQRKAIANRPSRFGFASGGSSGSRRSSGGESIFSNKEGSFMDFGSGPSLNFLTGNSGGQKRRKDESGLGKGLTDLF